MLRNCYWHSYFMIQKNIETSDFSSHTPSIDQNSECIAKIFVFLRHLFKKIYFAIHI
jgi:hypothetical protein